VPNCKNSHERPFTCWKGLEEHIWISHVTIPKHWQMFVRVFLEMNGDQEPPLHPSIVEKWRSIHD
jgi:hypothetical protein